MVCVEPARQLFLSPWSSLGVLSKICKVLSSHRLMCDWTQADDSLNRDHPADEVYVTGTFDDWAKSIKLDKEDGRFAKRVQLPLDQKILYKVGWPVLLIQRLRLPPDYASMVHMNRKVELNPRNLLRNSSSTFRKCPKKHVRGSYNALPYWVPNLSGRSLYDLGFIMCTCIPQFCTTVSSNFAVGHFTSVLDLTQITL